MTDHLRAATHDGTFHADDVLSSIVLETVTKERGHVYHLTRTRDPKILADQDVVFDVGTIHDPATMRFDHHMRDRPLRPDGTPFSSLGLVWAAVGREYVSHAIKSNDIDVVEAIWAAMDAGIVRTIDAIDNGVDPPSAVGLPALVDVFNAPWDQQEMQSFAFEDACRFARPILEMAARHQHGIVRARALVEEAIDSRSHPHRIELPTPMPWQEALHTVPNGTEILHVVYRKDHAWFCKCVPVAPGSFEPRLPLPTSWHGLRDSDLTDVTGVPDAVFCHMAGFVCGAGSHDGILAMSDAAFTHR